MKNDFDIENTLKNYEHDTDPRVKRAVLDRFAQRSPSRMGSRLFHRPVPLYLAAAQIIIALGLGFFIARVLPMARTPSTPGAKPAVHGSVTQEPSATVTAKDIEWEIAPNDVL